MWIYAQRLRRSTKSSMGNGVSSLNIYIRKSKILNIMHDNNSIVNLYIKICKHCMTYIPYPMNQQCRQGQCLTFVSWHNTHTRKSRVVSSSTNLSNNYMNITTHECKWNKQVIRPLTLGMIHEGFLLTLFIIFTCSTTLYIENELNILHDKLITMSKKMN